MLAMVCVSAFTVALLLQPDGSGDTMASWSPFDHGEVEIIIALCFAIAGIFAFDMIRTWRETNRWKREARRRRRDLR
jgi:hypothetical protein